MLLKSKKNQYKNFKLCVFVVCNTKMNFKYYGLLFQAHVSPSTSAETWKIFQSKILSSSYKQITLMGFFLAS